ncbi:phosphatidylinositol 4-phosphate 5-kinase 10 [Gossypium hirsutum]|uniref:1-phosphatidylinositol-4-phosphate 5-kinase n=3 Tax=Gossypium TaxID=3633 RepID=A0A1U8KPK1_GOSHI|nr:phosphatidylinositol 4-phosphate 5-kinase 10-like [Gossypium hirsutum]TYH95753.1 hypothetical protein ES332_A12G128400v1 [Gossypium tomentosum]
MLDFIILQEIEILSYKELQSEIEIYMAFSDKELMTTDYMIQCSRRHCNNLPPGIVTGFEWKDYCPKSFRLIQELENIDNDDYMMLVCSDETIKQVTSTMRPGNMFLFSNDSRFAIKTLRKSELKVLLEMLPSYYSHIKRFRSTILNKLYGAHVVKPAGGTKVYFVVVANIFKSDLLMHRCYDLKGSLQGRKVEKMRYREKTLHKESDLDFLFYLEPLVRQRLLKQIKYDCAFLEAAGIMNYSLMLGLHVKGSHQADCVNSKCSNNGMRIFNVALHQSDVASQRSSDSSYKDSTSKYSTTNIMDIISNTSFSENEASEVSFGDQWLQNNSCKFGEELDARGVRISKNGTGTLSCQNFTVIECYDVLLCFGIVDFFQNYNVIKRIEHAYKSLQFDRKMIAAVNPKIYSSRFQEFISDIFKADEPLN